jgi:hypothetical protein
MKRKINFILTASFILLMAVVIFLFIADWQFNFAKKFESAYLWKKTEEKYRLAIKLDPFNAQYLAGYGDFLRNKTVYQEDRIGRLISAEKLYCRALELNPASTEYVLHLGQVRLELFSLDRGKFKDRLYFGLNDLKAAVKNYPQDCSINYAAGYIAVPVWNDLDAAEKEWVLERLRYSLQIKPLYGEHIYLRLWQITKDPALLRRVRLAEPAQEKREKLERVARLKKGSAFQSDWQGRSKDGDNIYRNGEMYWTGTMDTLINVPEGKAAIKVQARGSPAYGIWPHMIVELDGEEIGETFVESRAWEEYVFKIDTDGKIKVLSVTFANDDGSWKEEDRNLYLGKIAVM